MKNYYNRIMLQQDKDYYIMQISFSPISLFSYPITGKLQLGLVTIIKA